jgi:hypothetical protein
MPTYDFELTFTGLCILTLHGPDKRRPDEANVLLVKTDGGGHPGHPGHLQHFPLLSFSTARDARPAAGSTASFNLLPTPDGRQLGIAELGGALDIAFDGEEENVPGSLTAHWRPAGTPETLAPDPANAAEQAWLNWVPLLKKVNPGLKAPTEEAPFAGLRGDLVSARLKLTRGELKAANLIRQRNGNGQFVIWSFKPPGDVAPVARQAMAAAVVLRFSGLTQPVWIQGGTLGRLGLVGQRQDELVQVSITNLPKENSGPSDRLDHFARFYDLAEFDVRPRDLALPEAAAIIDTSVGTDCPGALHTVVPDA